MTANTATSGTISTDGKVSDRADVLNANEQGGLLAPNLLVFSDTRDFAKFAKAKVETKVETQGGWSLGWCCVTNALH